MLRSAGTTARITNGIAITACASGTSTASLEKSTGDRSNATRKPNPTVTADVPSGSISSASIVRVARPGRDAITTDASPPITSAITVAIAANTSELRSAVHGETNSVLVDALEPSARYDARSSARRRAAIGPRARAAGRRGTRVVAPSTTATTTRSRPRGRRARVGAPRRAAARPRAAPAARAITSSDREHGDDLQTRERGRGRQVEELDRLAVDLDLERRVRGVGEQQHDAERREREQEHDRRGREQRRAEQRQRHLAERRAHATRRASAPPRRGAGRGCAQNPPTVRTTTATLKNTCATSSGATPRCQSEERERAARPEQREERGRDHDRRQHERHRHERAERRAGPESRSARRRTPRAARPASVSSVDERPPATT